MKMSVPPMAWSKFRLVPVPVASVACMQVSIFSFPGHFALCFVLGGCCIVCRLPRFQRLLVGGLFFCFFLFELHKASLFFFLFRVSPSTSEFLRRGTLYICIRSRIVLCTIFQRYCGKQCSNGTAINHILTVLRSTIFNGTSVNHIPTVRR